MISFGLRLFAPPRSGGLWWSSLTWRRAAAIHVPGGTGERHAITLWNRHGPDVIDYLESEPHATCRLRCVLNWSGDWTWPGLLTLQAALAGQRAAPARGATEAAAIWSIGAADPPGSTPSWPASSLWLCLRGQSVTDARGGAARRRKSGEIHIGGVMLVAGGPAARPPNRRPFYPDGLSPVFTRDPAATRRLQRLSLWSLRGSSR